MSEVKVPIGSWHARLIGMAEKPCYEITGPDGWKGWWYTRKGERFAVIEFVRWLFPQAHVSVEEIVCTFPPEVKP